jgi:hypothetical protein
MGMFLLSVAFLILVFGTLGGWAVREELRRRRAQIEKGR